MRVRILPYKQGSASAKALATEVGGKVLKLEGSKFKYKTGDLIINWGNSKTAVGVPLLNYPNKIAAVSDKLLFFKEHSNEDYLPEFWVDKDAIPDDAFPVVCRTVLNGHSGAGIVIADDCNSLVPAPLYVKYMKKKDEYRIHVGRKWHDYGVGTAVAIGVEGEFSYHVISVQRKARKLGVPDEEVNWQVRNYKNGFVYVRENVKPPQEVLKAATAALEKSGLDFGAVDVIWNDKNKKAYVLEINTAPGLEGQTVKDYAAYFGDLYA